MDFYEVEGKRLFERFHIPTDHGMLYSPDMDLSTVPLPCAVKAQVLSGKRGKAGGIRFADTREQLAEAVQAISQMTINGKPVEGIYLTPKIAIQEEHYLSFTLDRRTKCILMLYTPCGGMDIEALAADSHEKLLRLPMGLRFDPQAVDAALAPFGLPEADRKAVGQIAARLFQLFLALDATTAEINPLAKLADGSFTAADAKLVLDDNALYRQGDYTLIPRRKSESQRARQAREAGLAYVELDQDGDLGVIAGGAGIGPLTLYDQDLLPGFRRNLRCPIPLRHAGAVLVVLGELEACAKLVVVHVRPCLFRCDCDFCVSFGSSCRALDCERPQGPHAKHVLEIFDCFRLAVKPGPGFPGMYAVLSGGIAAGNIPFYGFCLPLNGLPSGGSRGFRVIELGLAHDYRFILISIIQLVFLDDSRS